MALTTVLCAAAAANGCSGGDGSGEADSGGIGPGDRYVAIGDSYTAAYLTGETDPESGACLRSSANYPSLVADELDLRLSDVSCGGATTEAVSGSQALADGTAVEPQLASVSEDTDLVTISLGANDYNTFGAIVVNCVQLAPADPQGSPCADLVTQGRSAAEIRGKIDEIRDRLIAVIDEVTGRAPSARVVVVGYPQAFPESGACAQLPLAAGDVRFAHDLLHRLTRALEKAAEAAGVEYLDVWSASAGHDMCAEDPWIAGAKPIHPDGWPYHPFPREQRLVADLLVDLLRS